MPRPYEQLAPASQATVHRAHKAASWLVKPIVSLTPCRITASGTENIPASKSFIAAFSHHNSQDFIGLSYNLIEHGRGPVRYTGKETLYDQPLQARLINLYGSIPAGRDNQELDFNLLRTMVDTLQEKSDYDNILGVAAEGGRIVGDRLGRLNKVVGYLAVMANVPIVPVGIAGQNWNLGGKPRWFIPRSLHVNYGPAIVPDSLEIELARVESLKDLPRAAIKGAHQVNKELASGLEAAFSDAYSQYAAIHGQRAAGRLDRS